jgi:hypothetical protein
MKEMICDQCPSDVSSFLFFLTVLDGKLFQIRAKKMNPMIVNTGTKQKSPSP